MNLEKSTIFLLSQQLTLLVNRYEYYTYDNNIKGELCAYAEQKRFSFREQFTLWKTNSKDDVLLTVKAEKIIDVHGRFIIKDNQGNRIGYCKKDFGASLFISTWHIYDAEDNFLFSSEEANVQIASIRRIIQFIPIISEISSIIPFNFVMRNKQKDIVGSHKRTWKSLADSYLIELGPELSSVDRRIIFAFGILLDALQDR